MSVETGEIETQIPARLDRLPWSRFHWLVVLGLGTVWILDGLEVTMAGSVASRLTEDGSGISISTGQIGTAAAIYVGSVNSGLRPVAAHNGNEREPGCDGSASGPVRSTASPGMVVAWPVDEDSVQDALDEQVLTIVRVLEEHGATDRRELARLVRARSWGPGGFVAALRLAILSGEIKVVGRRRYAVETAAHAGTASANDEAGG